ncbi:thermonuclease family protein [Synechococcus sp. CBW1004]|nr:thermonuclease family protein [Synechococcus sp. CBW1004]
MSVGDGDTLRVSNAGRPITIRLACIDAPETAQSPYGQQSRAYLQQRLPPGRQVSILPHTTDRYGRTVAEVISDININLEMVEDGQAFAYRRYLSGCNAKEYLDAEYRASRHRYGVWQVQGGTPEKRLACLTGASRRTGVMAARIRGFTATGDSAASNWQMLLGATKSQPRRCNAQKPGINRDKKEAEEPQDLLGTHHQECHRDRRFCTLRQASHDQLK